MADPFSTVTTPELPALLQTDGSELVAVWRNGRLSKMPQRDLRGTKTFSGPGAPPYDASRLFTMQVSINDRWRNTTTRDEYKLTSLDPVTWDFDGNVGGKDGAKGEPGAGISPKGQFANASDLPSTGQPGDLYVAVADDTAVPPAFLAGDGAMYVAMGGTFGPSNRYRNIGPFRGEQGPPGPGTSVTSVASVAIPANTNVVDLGGGRCAPANPANAAHRGKLLGLVLAPVAQGGTATIQTYGPIENTSGSFVVNDTLFIALNGGLTNVPPTAPTYVWRQVVGKSATVSDIVYAPGEASVIQDAATAIVLPTGGFASKATSAEAVAGAIEGKWIDPAGLQAALSVTGRHFGMAPFGAIGDGIADDTQAVAAAYAAGVYKGAPGKTYLVSALPAITAANAFIDQSGTTFRLKPGALNSDADALARLAGPNILWAAPTFDGNQTARTTAPTGSPLLVSLNNCPGLVCYGLHVLNSPSRGFAADGISGRLTDFRCEGNAGLGAEFNRCGRVLVSQFAFNRNGCGFKKTKANPADTAHDFVGFGVAVRYRSEVHFVNGEARLNGRDGINFNQGSSGSVAGKVIVDSNDDGGITIASDMVGSGIPGDGERCHDIVVGPDVETHNSYCSGVAIYQPGDNIIVRGRHRNNHRNAGALTGSSSYWNGVYVAGSSSHVVIDVDAYDDRPDGLVTAASVSGSDVTLTVSGATFNPTLYPVVATYDQVGAFRGFGKLTNASPSLRATAFEGVDVTQIASGWLVTAAVQHNGVMCDNGVTALVDVRGYGFHYGTTPALQGRSLVSGAYASGQNVIARSRSRGRELLVNPTFDGDLSGVTANVPGGGDAVRETGNNRRSPGSLKLIAGTSDAMADLGLVSGFQSYVNGSHVDVSVLALSPTGGAKLQLFWQVSGATFNTDDVADRSTTWQTLRIGADIPPDATNVIIRLFTPAGRAAWFDEASFTVALID